MVLYYIPKTLASLQESLLESLLVYLPAAGLIIAVVLLLYFLLSPIKFGKYYLTIADALLVLSVIGLVVYYCLGLASPSPDPFFVDTFIWLGYGLFIVSLAFTAFTLHQYGMKMNVQTLLSVIGLALVSLGIVDYLYKYYESNDPLSVLQSVILGFDYSAVLGAIFALSFVLVMIPIHRLIWEYKRSEEAKVRIEGYAEELKKVRRGVEGAKMDMESISEEVEKIAGRTEEMKRERRRAEEGE